MDEKLRVTEKEIVGADDDGEYVFGSNSSGTIVSKYNSKLEFEKRQKVETKVGTKAIEILNYPFPVFFRRTSACLRDDVWSRERNHPDSI